MKNETAGFAELGNWYAAAAVAVAGLTIAGGVSEADAAQIVVYPVGGSVSAPTTGSGGLVYFNLLDQTGTAFGTATSSSTPPYLGPGEFAVAWIHNASGTAVVGLGLSHGSVLGLNSSGSYAARLRKGAAVGPVAFGASNFFSKGLGEAFLGGVLSSSQTGLWKPGDDKYLGLNAYSAGSGGSQSYYGWAEIQLGSNYQPTLIAWGYNDEPFGTAYTGGTPAPEPSSLLLLASGAAGLAAYRRRRSRRRAAASAAQMLEQ